MLASMAFQKPDDLACYAALRIDPRIMRDGELSTSAVR